MDKSNINSTTDNKENKLLEDVPETGAVFLCGKTRFNCDKFHVKNDLIIHISCGDEHTGVVTGSGRVFMFGSNNWGQLGLGHEKNIEKPSCVKSLKKEKAKLIACGRSHTIVATESGYLYGFGSNSESQLGIGDLTNQILNLPQKLPIESKKWKMLVTGATHSCALTENGEIYAWGMNEYGQCSIKKIEEVKKPTLVTDLNLRVSLIDCGYYHTALITTDGKLFICGSNESGQLGLLDKSSNVNHFTQVTSIKEQVVSISCGGQHTLALTNNGTVYSFGEGLKGQLGQGPQKEKSLIPEKVKIAPNILIKQIACGETHSAMISDKGFLYVFGDNGSVKLGLDDNSYHFTPVKVEKFSALNVKSVSCGGCHMVLVATLNSLKQSMHKSPFEKRKSSPDYAKINNDKSISNFEIPKIINEKKESKYDNSSDEDDVDQTDDLNNSFTFNRTHTLTRENKFIPLSEINLKKAAEEEKLKGHIKPEENYNAKKLSTSTSFSANDNKNQLSKYNTSKQIKSDGKINLENDKRKILNENSINSSMNKKDSETEITKPKPVAPQVATRTCIIL